jgi:hypothetical protein
VPSTRILFDTFRGTYGYAEFKQMSNLGGHPGLMYSRSVTRGDATAFVFQPAQHRPLRAYMLRAIAIEGLEIGRIAYLANRFDVRELQALAERFYPLEQGAQLAFYVDVLSGRGHTDDI